MTLEYVVGGMILNNIFLYKLSSLDFSFRDIRKKLKQNDRYMYSKKLFRMLTLATYFMVIEIG